MSRLDRPETAFSVDRPKRQRSPREHADKHLAWIRTLPSLIAGRGPVEAAHIRYRDPLHAKPGTGLQQKPNDVWVVPLAQEVHATQHQGSEREFWDERAIDPVIIAAFLWAHTGNDEAGLTIIRNARAISARRHD